MIQTPTTHHTAENLQQKAIGLVQDHYNTYVLVAYDDLQPISADEIFVVWFCKTLQNWKALVSTHRPDNRYYEVTYDGDQKRTYIDEYDKVDNKVVKDEAPTFNEKTAGEPHKLPQAFGSAEFLAGDKHPDDITDQPGLYPSEWRRENL